MWYISCDCDNNMKFLTFILNTVYICIFENIYLFIFQHIEKLYLDWERIFLLVDLQTPYCNFLEITKNLVFFLFYLTFILSDDSKCYLYLICIVEFFLFLRFCLCIYESDTVKSNFPVMIFRKMMKYLLQTVGLPY